MKSRVSAVKTPKPASPSDTANEARHTNEPSPEARRLAAAIVEVLAGFRTTTEAARGLGISLARYYQLEVRALDGLVRACEARRGRHQGSELAQLQRECERLRRDCARQQALVRATRRTVGLAETTTAAPTEVRPRRRRRPTARAMKVVSQLRRQDLPDQAATPERNPPELSQPTNSPSTS
jgi:hypothetical protein